MRPGTSALRIKMAWGVAVAVDALQLPLWPATVPGVVSPVEWILDLAAMAVLWRLLGWSWAFLPSFVVELIPFVDLTPTWTLAVLVATRGPKADPPPGRSGGNGGAEAPLNIIEGEVVTPKRDR